MTDELIKNIENLAIKKASQKIECHTPDSIVEEKASVKVTETPPSTPMAGANVNAAETASPSPNLKNYYQKTAQFTKSCNKICQLLAKFNENSKRKISLAQPNNQLQPQQQQQQEIFNQKGDYFGNFKMIERLEKGEKIKVFKNSGKKADTSLGKIQFPVKVSPNTGKNKKLKKSPKNQSKNSIKDGKSETSPKDPKELKKNTNPNPNPHHLHQPHPRRPEGAY